MKAIWISVLMALTILISASAQKEQTAFIEPLKNITAAPGTNLEFSCSILHLGNYRVIWFFKNSDVAVEAILAVNGLKVTGNPKISFSLVPRSGDVTESILYLFNVSPEEAGIYTCGVNTEPMIIQRGTLEISEKQKDHEVTVEVVKHPLPTTSPRPPAPVKTDNTEGMPLYIKSPVPSQSILETPRHTLEATARKASPLPTFAMIRCPVRKVQETLLKNRDANANTSQAFARMSPKTVPIRLYQDSNITDLRPGHALTLTKLSPSTLKLLIDAKAQDSASGTPLPSPRGQLTHASSQNLRVTVDPPPRALSTSLISKNQSQQLFQNSYTRTGDPVQAALARLQVSAHALFEKMDLHPQTLKQILHWKASASKIPPEFESIQHLFVGDDSERSGGTGNNDSPVAVAGLSNVNLVRRTSSSYFPNMTIPCKRAYKYQCVNGSDSVVKATVTPSTSTPKFLVDIRESISEISMVPLISSTNPPSPDSENASESDFSESDVSNITRVKVKGHIETVPERNSLPVLRSKMKKLMRTLSDMNAVPDVMDILIDNLPTVVKMSLDSLPRSETVAQGVTSSSYPSAGLSMASGQTGYTCSTGSKPKLDQPTLAMSRSRIPIRIPSSIGARPITSFQSVRPSTNVARDLARRLLDDT